MIWLALNFWYAGDALAFYRGPDSAAAIQGAAYYPGKDNWAIAWLQFRTAASAVRGPASVLDRTGRGGRRVGQAGGLAARAAVAAAAVLSLESTFRKGIRSLCRLFGRTATTTPATVWRFCLWPPSPPRRWWPGSRHGWRALRLSARLSWPPARPGCSTRIGRTVITWKESQVNSVARRAWTAEAADFLARPLPARLRRLHHLRRHDRNLRARRNPAARYADLGQLAGMACRCGASRSLPARGVGGSAGRRPGAIGDQPRVPARSTLHSTEDDHGEERARNRDLPPRTASAWLPSRLNRNEDSVHQSARRRKRLPADLAATKPRGKTVPPRPGRSVSAIPESAPMAGCWSPKPPAGEKSYDGAIQLFNSDGSSAELSGNGTRCAAAFLIDVGMAGNEVRIRTGAGIKKLRLLERSGLFLRA